MTLKKKVLILGSTGMLGHQVVKYFEDISDFIVNDISYRKKLSERTIVLDAMNKAALEKIIVKLNPDFIINCIGILIRGDHDQEKIIYLNAYLPHQLKKIAKKINSKLIHVSSDCVFSGLKGQYMETDLRDGQGLYSQTKKLGEINDDTNLTIRTSFIGPELKNDGEGIFHWFMNQTGTIEGFKKSIWSGVSAIELSKAIKWAIENNITGLYHVTNNSFISKYDLLQLFKKCTKKSIRIEAVDGKPVDKSFRDTRLLIDYEIPSYEKMVNEMIDLVASKRVLYSQYNVESFDKR
jgi:dTDP-4-dehydrorhamnose reductase